MRARVTTWGVAASLWLFSSAAFPAYDLCLVGCNGGTCSIVGGSPTASAPPRLKVGKYVLLPQCSTYAVGDGKVTLRYFRQGKWFGPPNAVESGPLATVLKQYPPDTCPVPVPECIQERQSRKRASVAGHGIDGRESQPGGTGDPCSLGLPCGRVLPPMNEWRFSLKDKSIRARLELRVARGTPPSGVPGSFAVEVVDGMVSLPGRNFTPGATYTYRLTHADGSAHVTGEFAVLAGSLVAALQNLSAKRQAEGLSERDAWIETLAANELDWDAHQLLQQE